MIFKRELAEKIIAGEKTATRRGMSDNERSPWWRHGTYLFAGREFAVQPGRGIQRVATARVTAIYRQRLCNVTEADARKEGFKGRPGVNVRQVFFEAWAAIYGHVEPNDEVWVIEFELVGPTSQRAA
jgi:hypothetical protein